MEGEGGGGRWCQSFYIRIERRTFLRHHSLVSADVNKMAAASLRIGLRNSLERLVDLYYKSNVRLIVLDLIEISSS